jgi:uncharacterized damage-inducible protein DinB
MTDSAPAGLSLAPFYEGWENYNRLLVTAVAPLTPDQLTLRVASGQRTLAEIAAHIVSARASWFRARMGEGVANLEAYYTWDDEENPPTLNAAELELGLETTWRMIEGCLERWTPADLGATFTTSRGHQRTRQWIIWHVIEHDLHHGGELSLTLGSHGLAAPDL